MHESHYIMVCTTLETGDNVWRLKCWRAGHCKEDRCEWFSHFQRHPNKVTTASMQLRDHSEVSQGEYYVVGIVKDLWRHVQCFMHGMF